MRFPFGSSAPGSRTILRVLRGAAVAVTLAGIAVGTGCGSSSSTPSHGSVTASPDAVAINVYKGTTLGAACSGTLLSSHVVMTAAHCADGADAIRVKAPNAQNQSVEVERVLFYDWGQEGDHSKEHDVALLVLRAPITASSYAQLDDNPAFRVPVRIDGRFTDSPGHTAATHSDPVTVAATAPDGRPFALALKASVPGAIAGGAVRRDNGAVLGVYSGQGTTTNAGYFARIDDANLQIWLRAHVTEQGDSVQIAPGAGASFQTGSIGFGSGEVLRNTGGGTGGSGGGSASEGSGTGGSSANDPNQTPGEDTGDGTADDASGDDSEGRPKDVNKLPDPKLGGGSPTAEVKKGSNYYAAFEKGDPAAAGDPDKAYADKHPNVAEIGSHGEPGSLVNAPSKEDLQAITKGKDGVVTAACFAGATPKGGGQSTAAKIAAESGISPDKVYGCTKTMSLPSSGDVANCKGKWVTGSGKDVDAATKAKLGLRP